MNKIDYRTSIKPIATTPPGITADDITTEKLLNVASYSTHQYGKWHLVDSLLPRSIWGEHPNTRKRRPEPLHKYENCPEIVGWNGTAGHFP